MKKYKLEKGFIIKKIGDGITIFDADKSLLYSLNKTGSYIFSRIKIGWDTGKIAVFLTRKYKVKKSTVQKDLRNLIIDLLSRKIITQIKE